jgi:hypothetical protein
MKLLHLPTLPTIRSLAYSAHSYVILRKNHAFDRWIGLYYSSSGRLLYNTSHQSERQVLKKLLIVVEKRLSNYSI